MDLTIAILAGGASRRFGSDKTLASFRGKPLIAHLAGKARGYSSDLLVLSKTPAKYEFLNARSVSDSSPKQCPLSGIITALEQARHDKVFIIAADTPLFPFNALEAILSSFDCEAALPVIYSKVYPCAALYKKSCLPTLKGAFERGDYRLTKAAEQLKIKYFDEEFFKRFCRPQRAFVNVNTKEDLSLLNPPIVAFAGYSDSGKTTAASKVIRAFSALGYKAAAVKHDGSLHQLYEEGKDSHKHKAAGAVASAVVNAKGYELAADADRELTPEDFLHFFPEDTDIVIAEGFKTSPLPKIEVVRETAPRLTADNIIGEMRADDDPHTIVRLLIERYLT